MTKDLNARINEAKLLDWSELHAHLVFRLFVRGAYNFGDAKKLADFLRFCGPKAYLNLDKGKDPTLLLKLLAHIIDDIAALIDVGILIVKKQKGRGRPSDPRLERSLEQAEEQYKRARKVGAFVGISLDDTPILKRLSRADALKLVVKAWNRDVNERRERHRREGRDDPNRRTFIVKITEDQLEKQIDRRRPSARRYAKQKARTKTRPK